MARYAIVLFLIVGAFAQTSSKVKVHVTHEGEDQVGARFAFAFREAVQKSSRFELTEEAFADPAATRMGSRVAIDLVSVSTSPSGTEENSAAVAVIATTMWKSDFVKDCWQPLDLIHLVVVVGRAKTDEVALQVLSEIDKSLRDSKLSISVER